MAIFKKKPHQEAPSAEPMAEAQDLEPEKTGNGLFKRLRHGLTKTRSSFTGRIDTLFAGKKEITETLMDELEEILFTSDMGVGTTQELLDAIREKLTRKALERSADAQGDVKGSYPLFAGPEGN
jgi:fused signal recognition particle receptor